MKRIILVWLVCAAVASAQDKADLKIMIDKWQQMVAPGQILKIKPKTALIFNRSDLERIQDAKKIDDDQGMIAELVKKEQAVVTEAETEVRLLDKFWALCFTFFGLHMNCNDSVPDNLQNQFSDLTAPPNAKHDYSPAQLAKFRGEILNHDLSSWVEDHYLRVRIVGGKHDAVKGWIRMSEAQYP